MLGTDSLAQLTRPQTRPVARSVSSNDHGASAPSPVASVLDVDRGTSDAGLGNRLLMNAATRMRNNRTVVAQIRHRVNLFGHRLIGTGTYHQRTREDAILVRWDLQMPVGEEVARLEQVSDGLFLWSKQVTPSWEPGGVPRVEISRINLDEVHVRAEQSQSGVARFLAVEGLPQLLTDLSQHFQFRAPAEVKLQDVPGYGLLGKSLANSGTTAAQPPATRVVPVDARIVMGRDDLFPYLIELRDAEDRPLLILEFHGVQIDGDVDPLMFVFKPHGAPFSDKTREHIQSVRTSRGSD